MQNLGEPDSALPPRVNVGARQTHPLLHPTIINARGEAVVVPAAASVLVVVQSLLEPTGYWEDGGRRNFLR